MSFTKLILESTLFALKSLVANKLRTFLSLLGVVIGIFVIILILAAVDSLKKDVNESISSLGDDVVFIHKWPWEGGLDYPWWKYWQRPQPELAEMELIEKNCYSAAAVSYRTTANRTIEYRNSNVPSAEINGVWINYDKVHSVEIGQGRYLTENEIRAGRNVAILGNAIAVGLFGNIDPIGKTIKINDKKFQVIGVLAKEGESLFGNGTDRKVYISYTAIRSIVDLKSWRVHREIVVRAKEGVSNTQLKDELTGLMRSIRKLKPTEDDDFSFNEASIIAKETAGITTILNIVGIVIGLLAMLVGAFGISNIMFVSVKERTDIIGIQKALGAKRRFILFQFIVESLVLSLIGGILGILLVFLCSVMISSVSSFNLSLSLFNVFVGVFLSSLIGLISGIAPAYIAARLNPVDAIRSK